MKKSLLEIDIMFNNTQSAIKTSRDNLITLAGHSYMLSHILPPYYTKMIKINKAVKFDIHNIDIEEAIDIARAWIS